MPDYSNVWILLWSPSQKDFHFETLDRAIKAGLSQLAEDRDTPDYIVVAAAPSREDLQPIRDRIKKDTGK